MVVPTAGPSFRPFAAARGSSPARAISALSTYRRSSGSRSATLAAPLRSPRAKWKRASSSSASAKTNGFDSAGRPGRPAESSTPGPHRRRGPDARSVQLREIVEKGRPMAWWPSIDSFMRAASARSRRSRASKAEVLVAAKAKYCSAIPRRPADRNALSARLPA